MKTRHITINVMGSLLVGDPMNPDSDASRDARAKFISELKEMKRLRVHAVSIDFWWGLLQPEEGPIDWTKPGPAYYDWIVNTIRSFGLKVIPILSFHQCGGNVGDDVYVPIPKWVWAKLKRLLGDEQYAKFVSEQGHACDEYVSFWATHLILDDYLAVVKSFREHFADRAADIAEINISLGPAGELRYPSYNSHDKGVDYPTRGALQCYSKLAIDSFRAYVLGLYGDEKGIDAVWGTQVAEGKQEILPPSDAKQFFANKNHLNMQYGRDFFDWYSQSPQTHARMILKGVFDILAADDSPMKGIDIGVKVPGIHWLTGHWEFDAAVTSAKLKTELDQIIADHARANVDATDPKVYGTELAAKLADHVSKRSADWVPETDGGVLKLGSRLAELAAGLIRTSDAADWEKDEAGRGYRPLIKLFSEFEGNQNSRLVLHFTCLEMADGEGKAENANSVAHSLVSWVGAEAQRQGVPIKGENAVWWNLPKAEAWERMRAHLCAPSFVAGEAGPGMSVGFVTPPAHPTLTVMQGAFEGLTVLRMSHVVEMPVANAEMAKTIFCATGLRPEDAALPEAQTVVSDTTKVTAQDGAERSQGPPADEKVA